MKNSFRAISSDPQLEFPNPIADISHTPKALPINWHSISLIMLLAFVIRLLVLVRQPCIWFDTYIYRMLTIAYSEGNIDVMLGLNINVYPVWMSWLMRITGLDFVTIGTIWNFFCAIALILPLYGWIRRQFNEQIAILSCLLYAFHDAFSSITPMVGRNATFWLFMVCTLCYTWRAVTEQRLWQFAVAGISFTLALHTRTEGLLLLAPLTIWPLCRLYHLKKGERRRFIASMLLLASVTPLFIFAFNVTILRDHDRWELGQMKHFGMAWRVVDDYFDDSEPEPKPIPSTSNPETSAVESSRPLPTDGEHLPANPINPTGEVPAETGEALAITLVESPFIPENLPPGEMTEWLLVRKQLVRLIKAIGYPYGVFLLVGLWAWRSLSIRPDRLAMFLFSFGNLLAVWLVWRDEFDSRYYLPLVMMSMAYYAQGMVFISQTAYAAVNWRCGEIKRVSWTTLFSWVTITTCVLLAAIIVFHPRRFQEEQLADIGRWVQQQQSEDKTIWFNRGREHMIRYSTYYWDGTPMIYRDPKHLSQMLDSLQQDPDNRPEFIVFWIYQPWTFQVDDRRYADFNPYKRTFGQLGQYGFQQVPQEDLPETCFQFIVFTYHD